MLGLKKNSTISKSNPDLEMSFNKTYRLQIMSAKVNFFNLLETTREKHVEKITKTYEDLYRSIKNIKILSIDAVS